MAEGQAPTMAEMKLDLKNTLKTEGQASSSFGVAEGVSLAAASEKAEHGGNAELLALDLEAAKSKVEKSGAGAFVAELTATCLDGIGKTAETWGKAHEWRAQGRIEKAKNERSHIESIIGDQAKRQEKEEQKKIMDARVKEINPDFQVSTGFWKGVGEKISSIGDAAKDVYKKWEKHWYKVNSKDAQSYANRADSAAKTADKLYAMAEDLRKQKKDVKQEQMSSAKSEQAGVKAEYTTEQSRANLAAKALEKARDKDYFMPAAGAMAEDVRDQGGDAALSTAQAATEKFANRAVK